VRHLAAEPLGYVLVGQKVASLDRVIDVRLYAVALVRVEGRGVPPSAETECDLITWTFETTPMRSDGPLVAAAMAARRPARPDPHMTRSYSRLSTIFARGAARAELNMC